MINAITSLGSEEEKLIKQGFPQLDVKNLLIIEEDRQPASPLKSFGMMGGGVALIVAPDCCSSAREISREEAVRRFRRLTQRTGKQSNEPRITRRRRKTD